MELAVSDFLYSNTKRRVLIPLANSENVTVQGAVATWRPRKSLRTRRQVATAPCTVPIRQQYPKQPHSKSSAGLIYAHASINLGAGSVADKRSGSPITTLQKLGDGWLCLRRDGCYGL